MHATEGRLIAKVIKDQNKTKSGLYISTPENKDVKRAVVISAGTPLKGHNQTFNEGDIIYYGNYQGVQWKEGTDEYIIMNLADVISYEPVSNKEVTD